MSVQPPKTIWVPLLANRVLSWLWESKKHHDDDVEYRLVEPGDVCEWKISDNEKGAATSCNKAMYYDYDPELFGYKLCPWCGKPIKFVREDESEEEDE
jgi:hypothetical protein